MKMTYFKKVITSFSTEKPQLSQTPTLKKTTVILLQKMMAVQVPADFAVNLQQFRFFISRKQVCYFKTLFAVNFVVILFFRFNSKFIDITAFFALNFTAILFFKFLSTFVDFTAFFTVNFRTVLVPEKDIQLLEVSIMFST